MHAYFGAQNRPKHPNGFLIFWSSWFYYLSYIQELYSCTSPMQFSVASVALEKMSIAVTPYSTDRSQLKQNKISTKCGLWSYSLHLLAWTVPVGISNSYVSPSGISISLTCEKNWLNDFIGRGSNRATANKIIQPIVGHNNCETYRDKATVPVELPDKDTYGFILSVHHILFLYCKRNFCTIYRKNENTE